MKAEIEESHFSENRQWDIVGDVYGVQATKKYDCCPEPYISLTYVFTIRRNAMPLKTITNVPIVGNVALAGPHFATSFFPHVSVISTMVVLSFLLGPKSDKKVLMNALAALASVLILLTLYQMICFTKGSSSRLGKYMHRHFYTKSRKVIAKSGPPLNDYCIFLVNVYGAIAVLASMALILNVITLHMAHSKWSVSPPSFMMSFYTSNITSKVLCIRSYKEQVANALQRIEIAKCLNEDDSNITRMEEVFAQDWILVIVGSERVLFAAFSAVFMLIAFAEF